MKMLVQSQLLCCSVQDRVLFFPGRLSRITSMKSEKGSDDDSGSPSETKTGVGFGLSDKKKRKGQRERGSIIRRSPVEKPSFVSEGKVKEENKNESAFLLAWLGFGVVILVEGIALAASGFLPEQWDQFFVNFLYPSFTPTVFLFVAGGVAYGVLKYLQNENITEQK